MGDRADEHPGAAAALRARLHDAFGRDLAAALAHGSRRHGDGAGAGGYRAFVDPVRGPQPGLDQRGGQRKPARDLGRRRGRAGLGRAYAGDPAGDPVDLSGWALGTAPDAGWPLPDGTLLTADTLLILAPGDATLANHADFTLDPNGDDIFLLQPTAEGTCVADHVALPRLYNDVSHGRSGPDPTALEYFVEPTPGAPNTRFPARLLGPTVSTQPTPSRRREPAATGAPATPPRASSSRAAARPRCCLAR